MSRTVLLHPKMDDFLTALAAKSFDSGGNEEIFLPFFFRRKEEDPEHQYELVELSEVKGMMREYIEEILKSLIDLINKKTC